jgi:hypothetical protein
MGAERRTRITIETERILVIARQHAARGWCERCGCEVELLPSSQAGRLLNVGPQQSEGRRQNKVHLVQAKEGLVVCLKSLLRFLQAASGRDGSQ